MGGCSRVAAVFFLTLLATSTALEGQASFQRGDVDGNGALEITDPVSNLAFQFLGTFEPSCADGLDFDDNGRIEFTDPMGNLPHQFSDS